MSSSIESLTEEEKAEKGAMLEAKSRALAWTQPVINLKTFSLMKDHSLPAPQHVVKLLYAIGSLLGMTPLEIKDAGGDFSWDILKEVRYITHSNFDTLN